MSKSINNQLQPDMIEACYLWVKEQFFDTMPKRPIAKANIHKQATQITASKIGGFPYLPLGGSLPTNDDGEMFYLLAQIDCADLKGLPDFPTQGILQFFIIMDEMGMDYRVVYYPAIEPYYDDEQIKSIYQPATNDHIQIDEYAMTFELDETYPSFYEHSAKFTQEYLAHFNHTLNYKQKDRLSRHINYLYGQEFGDDVAKIACGGFAYFIQDDPRQEGDGYDVVLFQFASEQDINLVDMGGINFFITKWDLKDNLFDGVLMVFDYY